MKKTRSKSKRKGKTKKKKETAKRLVKRLATAVIIIGLILLSIHAFIDFFEKDIFNIVVKHIEKTSGGLYIINYDSVDLDFFQGGFHVKNLSIHLDKKMLNKIKTGAPLARTLVETTLPDLKIEGISILKLIFSQSFKMNKLSLTKGKLEIFKLVGPGQTVPILRVAEVSLQFSQLTICPYISFETGESTLKEPAFFASNGFYTLKARTLNLSESRFSSFISLEFLELIPGYEKYQFARKKGYQTDRFQLKIDNITSRAVDFNDLFKKQRFYSRLLTIKNPQIEVFRDKNIPRKPRRSPKKFPQQLLRELEFKLKLDCIRISNGHIDFIEHARDEKKAGKVFVNEIQANITNVTNYPGLLDEKLSIVLTASAKIMGKGSLKANLIIPLNNKENMFTFASSLGRLDMRVFNSILESNSHIRIRSGTIDKVDVSATCNNKLAKGEMKLFYRNLKISLLKVKAGGKYKKRGFKSFLANIILRQNNPKKPGKPLRVGRILFIREKPISVFAFIWKAILSGFKSSVGL
ncbi:MAG: hypothetical protein JSV88_08295 [Candidatus Aminicenantes bacterium]|nr:MAG: hypothetical protein JSV88_08295 [Candidatus Aminicenantes bacterium]